MDRAAGLVLMDPDEDGSIHASASSANGYPPIADYGLIGDGRSAALISRTGSIDWWCLPRFDGDPVLGRLLDSERGGFIGIRPVGPFRVARRYVDDTAVLVTDFTTESGAARVIDFMPALTEAEKRTRPIPYRCLVRRIVGVSGRVRLEVCLRPRPHYGLLTPRLRRRRTGHFVFEWDDRILYVVTHLALEARDGQLEAIHEIGAGERADLALAYSPEAPGDIPVLSAMDTLQELTESYWRTWVGTCRYAGPFAEAVRRSAITLKLLAYAPTGAIVAAPTTSLPEEIGGVRNWDYRYCWLRDAAATIRALLLLGYGEEAHAFSQWLLHLTRLTHPGVQVAYDVFGESRLKERLVPRMDGYRSSRPVRTGNAAVNQFQLDIYGEVLDALAHYQHAGGTFDRDAARLVRGLAETILRRWREPDNGIWEVRDERVQRVHSKVMAWVGLDRAVELAPGLPVRFRVDQLRGARDQVKNWVLDRGYDPALATFTSVAGSSGLDAALLQVPITGFLPADDPRVVGTVDAIRRRLGHDDLVFRYRGPDGLPGGEGAFLVCSFWLVEALAAMGRSQQASALFERLLKRRNELGLLSEEVDPVTGAALGNFPQGLSHIGLIIAALMLDREGVRHDKPQR